MSLCAGSRKRDLTEDFTYMSDVVRNCTYGVEFTGYSLKNETSVERSDTGYSSL